MRLVRPNMTLQTTWWWGFGLLVAAPALVLAVLGLRAVRSDRLEREQQLRERQSQAAHLADIGIRAALSNIERELRLRDSVQKDVWPQTAEDPDIHFFSFDRSGLLTFSRDRVYFGDPSPKDAMTTWPSNVDQFVEQARAAEAQRRVAQAATLYSRIITAEPRLSDWARLSVLHLEHKDDRQYVQQTLSGESPNAGGLTPGGLPVALFECAYVETVSVEERSRYTEFIKQALTQLRAGRWWLSLDERSFYDRELANMLTTSDPSAGAQADPRLQEIANIAAFIGAVPLRRDEQTLSFEPGEGGPILFILTPSQQSSTLWQGAALNGKALIRMLDDVIGQASLLEFSNAWVTDQTGNAIWRDKPENSAAAYTEPLSVVPGWTLIFGRNIGGRWLDQRTLLWLGFVVILIVMMLASLVGTMRVVRREADLARMQNDFIAGVSHEFKSPITSIRLLMERMTSGRFTSPGSPDDYKAAAEREMMRLERHVNRLLEAQQIQAGQRQYSFGLASVSDIAADAISDLTTQAEAKQIRIELEAGPDLPPLQLDRTAMTDALENLIGNAIKYSPAGSRINVAARLDGRHVCVEVCDQGIGIDRDDAPRIFNRFYRGRASQQQSVNGTGLGLALVKATVQAHGGNISVTSEPGKGSRFTINLPLEGRG